MTTTEPQSAAATADERPSTVDAVVVGAGFAGLYMLHRLREEGRSVRVLEAGDAIGGTWYFNRYPGARVDVKSMYYNFSFDSDLEQEWEWTEKLPPQEELLSYINHVADRFDLRKDIELNSKVTGATYDEGRDRWTVQVSTGEAIDTQFLVMATGCLSVPKMVEVPGMSKFAGRSFHTADWPKEKVDFTGRRVAVIGTGSSGVQVIPLIAEQAEQLTVFQRTANYVIPANNHPMDPDYQRDIKSRYRDVREANKGSGFGIWRPEATKATFEASAQERHDYFEDAWSDIDNELVSMLTGFTDTLTDDAANEVASQFVRDKIAEIVEDPATAKMLQPTGYPFGAKRPALGTNYYETFNRPNVRLVDVSADPLTEVTEAGLATTDETFEFDDIVYATGFDAMTGALTSIDIRGRGGELLRDRWASGAKSYLGIAVNGFPNMFTITGPGSPAVLSNMTLSIEQHVDWIMDAVKTMDERQVKVMEADEAADEEWAAHVAEVGAMTVYPQADSWYMGANVPGKARVLLAYPGGVGVYRDKCDQVAADGYPGFSFT